MTDEQGMDVNAGDCSSPQIPPTSPISSNGRTSEPVSGEPCRCGAVADPRRPGFCAGRPSHFIAGNTYSTKHGGFREPTFAEAIASSDFQQFDAEGLLKAQIAGARVMQKRLEKIRTRKSAERTAAIEQWNLLSGRILAAQAQLEALRAGKPKEQTPKDWLRTLPRDLLDALIQFSKGEPYTIMLDRLGYVCIRCAYEGGHWGPRVPSSGDTAAPRMDGLDAQARKQASSLYEDLAGPVLAVGNRPPLAALAPPGPGFVDLLRAEPDFLNQLDPMKLDQ
jgi:hypothetical protein